MNTYIFIGFLVDKRVKRQRRRIHHSEGDVSVGNYDRWRQQGVPNNIDKLFLNHSGASHINYFLIIGSLVSAAEAGTNI